MEAFQTEISCCRSHFDLTHSETFENGHCLWVEIVNHFVMTEKMSMNSPLLVGTVSVGWRQENLDWCLSVKRSGWVGGVSHGVRGHCDNCKVHVGAATREILIYKAFKRSDMYICNTFPIRQMRI